MVYMFLHKYLYDALMWYIDQCSDDYVLILPKEN